LVLKQTPVAQSACSRHGCDTHVGALSAGSGLHCSLVGHSSSVWHGTRLLPEQASPSAQLRSTHWSVLQTWSMAHGWSALHAVPGWVNFNGRFASFGHGSSQSMTSSPSPSGSGRS
jgi:hypothetical protein